MESRKEKYLEVHEIFKISISGRYWDRTSDHIDHVPQLVEIPTWFIIYTITQTFCSRDPKIGTNSEQDDIF